MSTRIVEIDGIKMEVDLRQAKRVDHFRVGDPVKLLLTSENSVHAGTIVDFEEFENSPTIVVAYLATDYFNAGLKFAYINSNTADKFEIIAADRDNLLNLNKADVLTRMDAEIAKAETSLSEAKQKRKYFLDRFGAYFSKTKETAA